MMFTFSILKDERTSTDFFTYEHEDRRKVGGSMQMFLPENQMELLGIENCLQVKKKHEIGKDQQTRCMKYARLPVKIKTR